MNASSSKLLSMGRLFSRACNQYHNLPVTWSVRLGCLRRLQTSNVYQQRLLSTSHLNLNVGEKQKILFHRTASCRKYSVRMPTDDVLKGFDETQVKLMEEECILIDKDDNVIGSASKKDCHLLENINKGMLHRAFSVFLFNTKGELLLQQRASEKITFPDMFTNTCCSHPLNFPGELEAKDAIGVKRAAQRKLKHELGIEPEQVPLTDFHYLTRLTYKAENVPKDNKLGEYELDYILFIQKDVDLKINPNEVKSYRYLSQQELKDFVASGEKKGVLLTPWFKLIMQNFLYDWWNKLDCIDTQADHDTIHRLEK